ncbi:MAG TPA: energy-coupling factor ABC transporter permease [Geopsychrobacteraceae bacterium]|nr:energy-coupling factor ABC transporter permease [Geopsychrobacteraceae bacterium]
MHMADALISPVVGGTMWAVAAGTIALCSERLKRDLDDRKIPLMGVIGAFIFTAQMINFAIPGTGSSGHIGGGMILAVLLGPAAGFMTMASVLTVQALFFADGGLLALGSNIVNLGALTCFIAYPLVFRPLVGHEPGRVRLFLACLFSAVIGLQLGSFGVVLETAVSGVSDLPFGSFLLLMQPIHLGIGLMEGIVTASVVGFVWKARPEILAFSSSSSSASHFCRKQVLVPMLVMTLLCGGLLSGFASTQPDGLEWSLEKAAADSKISGFGLTSSSSVFSELQKKTAILPGYRYPDKETSDVQQARSGGTSLSGLLGGGLTLLLIALVVGLTRLGQRRSVPIARS